MNEPMLGQTSRSTVESYLRAKREKGQLTDEEIARLDAIGFKWEKRKKKTIEEKVDLYVHYRESGKRWRCNETGERFRSLDDAFRKYGKEGDNLDTLRTRVRKGHTWHGMTITRCQTERPITSNSWWMPPTTSDTSGRAGRTGRLPTRSRRLPCSDGSNNGS